MAYLSKKDKLKKIFWHNGTAKLLHKVRQIKTPSRECVHVVRYEYNLRGVFSLETKVSYPVDVKMKAIEMRLAGIAIKEAMEQLRYT